jgi:hypothetical protein
LDTVGFDGAAQELAFGEDVLLAGVFLQGAGTHAGGQRAKSAGVGFNRFRGFFGGREQVVRHEGKIERK